MPYNPNEYPPGYNPLTGVNTPGAGVVDRTKESIYPGMSTLGRDNPAIFGANAPAPVANPLVQRYGGTTSEISALLNGLPTAPRNEVDIRAEATKNIQAQVDAVDKYYNTLVASAQDRGKELSGRTRAVNVRSGLSGSDFAGAAAQGADDTTRKEVDAVEKERTAKRLEILNNLESTVSNKLKLERDQTFQNTQLKLQEIEKYNTRTRDLVKNLAKSGTASLEDFKGSNNYRQILESTGMSPLELEAMYTGSLPEKDKPTIHWEKIGSKIIQLSVDPKTGKATKSEFETDATEDEDFKEIDGVPYGMKRNEDGSLTLRKLEGYTPGEASRLDMEYKRSQIAKNYADANPKADILSVNEAQALGVPYGTTKAQAQSMGKTPQKQATVAQETTALYANRIEQGNQIFDQLEPYTSELSTFNMAKEKVLPNFLKSANYQSLEQAQRNFVNAVLRRESGAVISPTEFDNAAQQYFPQPGDGDQVLAQKKLNRQQVQQGFIEGAGPAYSPSKFLGPANTSDLKALAKDKGFDPSEVDTLLSQNYTAEQIKQIINQ